jgi:hypothetical protein
MSSWRDRLRDSISLSAHFRCRMTLVNRRTTGGELDGTWKRQSARHRPRASVRFKLKTSVLDSSRVASARGNRLSASRFTSAARVWWALPRAPAGRRCRCRHCGRFRRAEIKIPRQLSAAFVEHSLANPIDLTSLAFNMNRPPYTSINLHLEHHEQSS